ncbi:MAG: M14 family zinc carboxypeptidase [Nocardioidaceae bacterium]
MSPVAPPAARSAAVALAALLTTVLAATLLAVVPVSASSSAPTRASARTADAVVTRKVIGHSVRGRPIVALRLGEPGRKVVVLIASMHGDEARPSKILRSLAGGRAISGIDLWVVPTYNPDGVARHSRKNAHGVDLNRNYPYHWADLDGETESGPHAASEPETRAMMRFLRKVKPDRIVSFHQPLNGVDTDTKDRRFAKKLARALKLPTKTFDCGGVCHGTMTGWYNHRFAGSAVTVEYGARPPARRLKVTAPRQLLKVLGATRRR